MIAIMTARAGANIITTPRASSASRVLVMRTASVDQVLLASLVAQVRGSLFYDLRYLCIIIANANDIYIAT